MSARTETPAQTANLGKRVGGLLLDALIVFVPLTIIGSLLFGTSETSGASFRLQLTGVPFLLTVLLWFGYFFVMESTSGQTLGKKIVGIRVVADEGSLGGGAVAVRTLLRIVDSILFYAVGFFVALASDDNKRIGDMVGKTRVVDAR